jgi:hypothetical protein
MALVLGTSDVLVLHPPLLLSTQRLCLEVRVPTFAISMLDDARGSWPVCAVTRTRSMGIAVTSQSSGRGKDYAE